MEGRGVTHNFESGPTKKIISPQISEHKIVMWFFSQNIHNWLINIYKKNPEHVELLIVQEAAVKSSAHFDLL